MWVQAQIKRIGEPYSITYSGDDYEAGNENWGVVKDKRGIMYFANTSGVLTFDGINWTLIKTGLPVKSLAIDTSDNTVYVGLKGDIGRLVNDEVGAYKYESLADKIPEDCNKFSDIWHIEVIPKGDIVFTATSALFLYHKRANDSINVITTKTGFGGFFHADGRLFVVVSTVGVKEIKDGKLVDADYLSDVGSNPVVYIGEKGGRLVIVNRDHGVYYYDGDSLSHPECSLPKNVLNSAYCICESHDGNYLIGTLAHGLIVADANFNYIRSYPLNGRVYAMLEDDNHLVWVASNKGIFLLDIFSPFSWFPNTETGISGTIRSILQVGDELYLGADAVYHINRNSLNKPVFQEISNPKGPNSVWKLDTIGGRVMAGGLLGLMSIDTNYVQTNIDGKDSRNVRNFVMPRDNPYVLIACSSVGFSIYEYKNGKWEYRKPAKGFDETVRNIYQDTDDTFVTSYKGNGVFRIKFNETYDSVVWYKKYDADKGGGLPSNANNYLFNTGNGLTVGTIDGFYKYDRDADKYVEDVNLNKAFGGKNVYDFMYDDRVGNLWVKHVVTNKRNENIQYWFLERFTMLGDTSAYKSDKFFRPYMSRINSFGYIGDGCYIIGDKDGFIHYDSRIIKDIEPPYNAIIRRIENIYSDSIIYGGNEIEGKIVLPYSQRSIRVKFGATNYEHPEAIKFKSFLEKNDDEWSDFRSENFKEYPNLSPGKYTLHVKAINCYDVESKESTITFQILAPWYLTVWAKLLYAILFGLLIWAFIKAYTKKLVRDNEKLEKIVEERTAEIRQQSQLIMEKNEEITAKNKEITDSIKYAQRIQTAMLPMEEKIQTAIPDHFILFRPKDIVSGDYYWYAETEQSVIITAADCTGHGVPGAFMSMIGSQILTEIVAEGITSPDDILTNQNRRIRKALKQDTTANQDGMDMALCRIDKKTHLVEYAGAKNQLVVIQNGELTEYKADKQSIGGQQLYGDDFQYKKVAIQPDGNTWFYMFSDGYKDQFGGVNNSKFLIKNLRALLMQIHNEPPAKQREILNDTIEQWIKDGNTEQTDDIILIGFKC